MVIDVDVASANLHRRTAYINCDFESIAGLIIGLRHAISSFRWNLTIGQDHSERHKGADAGDFVTGEIVHHNDIALAQDQDHELLDIGAKARPIHRPVEHTRRGNLADTQRRDECRGLPSAAT